MRKTIVTCLVMAMLFSLTGCSTEQIVNGSTVSLTSNDETLNTFVRVALTPESYMEYEKALLEQEKRSHYIDIEEQYHEALLKFHNDFSEAYNLGIIDENGISTGEINPDFDSFIVEKYNKQELLNIASQNIDKENLLNWLKEQRWITEGPEIEEIDNKYLDVLLSEFEISPGAKIGFTKETLELATKEDILSWLSQFYDIEKRNVDYYRERVSKLTEDELNAKVNELLSHNYAEPMIDKMISVIDDRHVITENTLKLLGVHSDIIRLTIYNIDYDIDTRVLGKKTEYGNNYYCQSSEDGKTLLLKVFVNGKEEVFNLPIEESLNKVNMSTYDIYRLLGMKVYV